jgi:hypothetical protein
MLRHMPVLAIREVREAAKASCQPIAIREMFRLIILSTY